MEVAAILPPLTLWSVSRFPGALRRNLLVLVAIASAAVLLARVSDSPQWWSGTWLLCRDLLVADAPRHRSADLRAAVRDPRGRIGSDRVRRPWLRCLLSFWIAPYAMRTYGIRSDLAGLILGVPGAFAAAAGCTIGGRL